MPGKDRLEMLIDQVAKLTAAVATLTEHQVQQAERTTTALEAHAIGLEGIGRLGSKVGALATAMDRNLDQVKTAREAFLKHQEKVAAMTKAAADRIRPQPAEKAGG